MSPPHVLATAVTLGLLGAAPTTNAPADVDLAGAPTLRVVDDSRVGLQITTHDRIARRNGRLVARIGRKYTLRLTLPGQATVVRQVKLHAQRG